ncbi:MAG: hypothetical protein ABMB14_33405 [Myxococcota bacterium]
MVVGWMLAGVAVADDLEGTLTFMNATVPFVVHDVVPGPQPSMVLPGTPWTFGWSITPDVTGAWSAELHPGEVAAVVRFGSDEPGTFASKVYGRAFAVTLRRIPTEVRCAAVAEPSPDALGRALTDAGPRTRVVTRPDGSLWLCVTAPRD